MFLKPSVISRPLPTSPQLLSQAGEGLPGENRQLLKDNSHQGTAARLLAFIMSPKAPSPSERPPTAAKALRRGTASPPFPSGPGGRAARMRRRARVLSKDTRLPRQAEVPALSTGSGLTCQYEGSSGKGGRLVSVRRSVSGAPGLRLLSFAFSVLLLEPFRFLPRPAPCFPPQLCALNSMVPWRCASAGGALGAGRRSAPPNFRCFMVRPSERRSRRFGPFSMARRYRAGRVGGGALLPR